MRDLSEVYHVGHLSKSRQKPYVSYEGKGLSVSKHPEEWARIMGGGGIIYRLTHPSLSFYRVRGDRDVKKAVRWAVENKYLSHTRGYEISWFDDVRGEERYMVFEDEQKARREIEGKPDAEIRDIDTYELDRHGVDYWEEAFRQSPEQADPIVMEDLSPVWLAREQGWWEETLDVANLSAPRGVIFQHRLSRWDTEEVGRV